MRARIGRSKLLKVLGLGAAAALLALAPTAAFAGKFKVLHSFCSEQSCHDGSVPTAPLVMDSAGNLYGTTSQGGIALQGTAFELKRTASGHYKFKKIMDFGHRPNNGGLIIDTAGKLYGIYENGEFFTLTFGLHKHKWQIGDLSVRCTQQNCGTSATGGLTYAGQSSGAPYDGSSPLYGAMETGGNNNAGIVYQLTPNGNNGWTESVLYNFCAQGGDKCSDGQFPGGGVSLTAEGLFGVAIEGGGHNDGSIAGGSGVVYQLSSNNGSWTETVLHSFCSLKRCADGAFPVGQLAVDSTGNFIGATEAGGGPCKRDPGGCGTVFQLTPAGADSVETVLYRFCSERDCRDGYSPAAGVFLDPVGNLFGTTLAGGGDDIDRNGIGGGVAYQLSGNLFKVLHRFCSLPNCADGEYPESSLISDGGGALYGTVSLGGEFDGGSAYRLQP